MISKVKAKILAEGYIKNNFNATETIKELEPYKSRKVAGVKASRMLESEVFKKTLEETMEEQGLNDSLVEKIHQRNLKQGKNLSASNEAINIYHKIKGNFAPEKKINLNINTQDPEAIKRRIESIQEELKQLNEPRPQTP